jgi:hypothetical protein
MTVAILQCCTVGVKIILQEIVESKQLSRKEKLDLFLIYRHPHIHVPLLVMIDNFRQTIKSMFTGKTNASSHPCTIKRLKTTPFYRPTSRHTQFPYNPSRCANK